MAGRQTPFVAVLVPLILVFIVDGKRGLRQTWPVALVSGIVFGLAQFFASNFLVVELTDVVAAIATVAAVLLMLRFWQPAQIIGMNDVADSDTADVELVSVGAQSRTGYGTSSGLGGVSRNGAAAQASTPEKANGAAVRPPNGEVWMAVAPYLIIMAVFSLAQIPAVKSWLTSVGSVTFEWPGLDAVDPDGKPVAAHKFKLDHLKATGTLLLISGIITMALYKLAPLRGLRIYRDTLFQLRWTIVSVTSVLALAFVMNVSGQTNSLGIALASAGGFFAFLSPLLGWIGVALTGSDTSSNSLFGQLQVTAAQQTGLSPTLMAASNSSAGVLGKMLSLQNLAVASAAVGLDGAESVLFRKLIGWSLALLAFITILIVLQSTPVLGWMVP